MTRRKAAPYFCLTFYAHSFHVPDAPSKITSPQYAEQQRKSAANSKPYWCHSTCTVWQYLHSSKAQQAEINSECRQIERAKQAGTAK